MASGTGAPSLADVDILSAPDGVTLPRNFSMARRQWLRTRLIVATCFGVDHNALEGLQNFGEELLARETELEEYTPPRLLAPIPDTGPPPASRPDPLVQLVGSTVG